MSWFPKLRPRVASMLLLGCVSATSPFMAGPMTIYGSRISTVDAHPLYELDAATGGLTQVGNFPFPTAAIALSPLDGLLYYTEWDVTDGRVGTWDPGSGAHSVVGTLGTGVPRFARLGFRLDGVLFGMDDACELYTVDTATGAASSVGIVTGASCSSGDLAFDRFDALFIVAGSSDSRLYSVDTGTLIATELHDVSTEQQIAGVVIDSDGDLFTTRTALLRLAAGIYSESTIGTFPVGIRLSDAAAIPELYEVAGTVFEDVNYGGGPGRNLAVAASDAPTFSVRRPGVTVELYDATGSHVATDSPRVTDPGGAYSFPRLPPGTYTIRVVVSSVTSSRAGSDGSELGVQTFRADGFSEPAGRGTLLVGGERPSYEDAPANTGSQLLDALQGTDLDADGIPEWTLSIAVVDPSTADVTGVDFGFNFDVIVNTNDSGYGSLRQFIVNSNLLR